MKSISTYIHYVYQSILYISIHKLHFDYNMSFNFMWSSNYEYFIAMTKTYILTSNNNGIWTAAKQWPKDTNSKSLKQGVLQLELLFLPFFLLLLLFCPFLECGFWPQREETWMVHKNRLWLLESIIVAHLMQKPKTNLLVVFGIVI